MVGHVRVGSCAFDTDSKEASTCHGVETCLQRGMMLHVHPLVIIQTSPAQPRILPAKAEGMNQVQLRPGVGAEPHDISRIGRDFWLK